MCKARQHGLTVAPGGQHSRWAEARWAYKCYARPWVLRGMAALACAASAVIVWSEATIGSGRSPDLSPFSLMVRSGVQHNEFAEQLLVALPLVYMCACAYFSLLKLGTGAVSFYHVVSCWWGHSDRQGLGGACRCGLLHAWCGWQDKLVLSAASPRPSPPPLRAARWRAAPGPTPCCSAARRWPVLRRRCASTSCTSSA